MGSEMCIRDSYISAFNVLPRIALVPLFILWFGLGIGSKIALGVSLTFFIVLSSTVAGIRGVSQDHVTLTRTLGVPAVGRCFFQSHCRALFRCFSQDCAWA